MVALGMKQLHVAISVGNMDNLRWLLDNGCPMDKRICVDAVNGGYLDSLKLVIQKGCPWDKTTCEIALQKRNHEIFQWARENGCAWNEQNKQNCIKNIEKQFEIYQQICHLINTKSL